MHVCVHVCALQRLLTHGNCYDDHNNNDDNYNSGCSYDDFPVVMFPYDVIQ